MEESGQKLITEKTIIEIVAALKHDLGKYVAWRSANFHEQAWQEPADPSLVDALVYDIFYTRKKGADAFESAWEIWDRLSKPLERPFLWTELHLVESAVDKLRAIEPFLQTKNLSKIVQLRFEIRAAQQTIRNQLRILHKNLREDQGRLNVSDSHH